MLFNSIFLLCGKVKEKKPKTSLLNDHMNLMILFCLYVKIMVVHYERKPLLLQAIIFVIL